MAHVEDYSSHRAPPARKRTRRAWLRVAQLENRELLSGSPWLPPTIPSVPSEHTSAVSGIVPGSQGSLPTNTPPAFRNDFVLGPQQSAIPVGEGYTPAQMRRAYGFNQIALPAGQTFDEAGSGQTIAVIDGLDDPYITSDLQKFDQTFSIGGAAHDPTSTAFFKVVNEYGGSTLPATDNGQFGYGMETSLDVEWAHAMAPGANILLVEATSLSLPDVWTAIEYAARQPGVSVISMSLSAGEWPTEYYLDNAFTTPAGHQGVSFVASAGDYGAQYNTAYMAMSPNVLSVGGTTLPVDASGNPNRTLETGWSVGSGPSNPYLGGGGGISYGEAEPAYQLGVQSTGQRTGPDLAYDGDPSTGVAVYDTLAANALYPGRPWFQIGGTSAGAPQISSLLAITNQLRVVAGESTLDGPNQLLPAIYQIAAADPGAFQDITTGNNGYPAGPGYDLVTGVGTPNAQYLVPDLVAAYSKPTAPAILYWTGDVNSNWNTPGNWSTVDPLVKNVPQSVLPTANDHVVVDLAGTTILHDANNYDTIRSFTVTAPNVTVDLGLGTLDLSGGGGRGVFQADQPGDTVPMEGAVLKEADVTSGTILSATSSRFFFYIQYPELNDVQLDGTLNANQGGSKNGIYIQNNLILNGTIHLGGTSDQSSVLLAGYGDMLYLLYGSPDGQDNSPETISGSGTIQFGQSINGDAIDCFGTPGTLTIGPNITILGGGPGSKGYLAQSVLSFLPTIHHEPPVIAGGFDNQGTIKLNGGSLQIDALGRALSDGPASSTTGWTNEGAITATGATLSLLGSWINYGTISADSTSTVWLGNPTYGQLPSDPNAAAYAWSSPGSLTIGDGATVIAGGFWTTDEYQGAANIPGFSAHFARDSLSLVGTLDNTIADNPVTGGVLALTAATGPLPIIGGTIYGGSIMTTGSNDVQVIANMTIPFSPVLFDAFRYITNPLVSGGWLDNLTNNGTVAVTGNVLIASNVTNSGTVNGTAASTLELWGTWENTNGAINVDSSSSLYLGTLASTDAVFPPTLADGKPYLWKNTAGTIAVANGATIGFGGLMTTDQFLGFASQPGISINLSQDTVLLDGWLDNSPADNPLTGGILAFTSGTGAVNLVGGYIYGGAITSSGSGQLNIPFHPDPLPFYTSVPNGQGYGVNVGFLDSVTNDSSINVNLPSYGAGPQLFLEGTVINNGTLALLGGTIAFWPGGKLVNNGSLEVGAPNSYSSPNFYCGSNLVNNGTITDNDGFLDVTLDAFPSYPQNLPPTLTNNGTITTYLGGVHVRGSTTNAGTISGTQSYLFFLGNWDNTNGTINVDSTSTLGLGFETAFDPNFPAPITDATPYAFNPSQAGTIKVANGATIDLGGLMTTDQFNAFPKLPGVHLNRSEDTMNFTGWLDNSPADNPISHGVLALSSSTGPLYLNGGYLYRGKITTSGSNDLEAGNYGFLDGVEVDGNLNVAGPYNNGTIYVLNGLTLNGTISMLPQFYGSSALIFGYLDNVPETITGTGTISFGGSSTYEALLADFSSAGLTIGSGITINAGATNSYLIAEGSEIENLGTLADDTAGSTLYTFGVSASANPNTNLYTPSTNGFANFSAGALSGGTWQIGNGAVWQSYGFDLTTNAANLSVSGAGTEILDSYAKNALAGLANNTAGGSFTVGAGYNFAVPAFGNAGTVDIQSGGSFSTGPGGYSQLAGTTTVDGSLTANVGISGGNLTGSGTVIGNVTNAGMVTPGDPSGTLTIQGNYTQTAAGILNIDLVSRTAYGELAVSGMATLSGALNVSLINGFKPMPAAWFTILAFAGRAGDFSTETGLMLGQGKFLVPSYQGNTLTLVAGPGVTVVADTFLYIIGGLTSNDQILIQPTGTSSTGSTGVKVTATLSGVSSATTLNQQFSAIYIYGFAGNDTITLAPTLTIGANISAGNGNDNVTAANGDNTITLGNGKDKITVGNGNNVVLEGNGTDTITAGNGDNLIVAGLGQHTVTAGNGSNILIDGSVQLTQSGDSLRQVLNDWIHFGASAANVASIRSRLAITYNMSYANTLDAGTGLDWFWAEYANDSTNRKPTDLLN